MRSISKRKLFRTWIEARRTILNSQRTIRKVRTFRKIPTPRLLTSMRRMKARLMKRDIPSTSLNLYQRTRRLRTPQTILQTTTPTRTRRQLMKPKPLPSSTQWRIGPTTRPLERTRALLTGSMISQTTRQRTRRPRKRSISQKRIAELPR